MATSKPSSKHVVDLESTAEVIAVSASQRDPAFAEFFGFAHQNTVFSFSTEGVPMSRKLAWLEEPALAKALANSFRIPLQFGNGDEVAELPFGIVVVSGDTGVGKSSFVRELARVMPVKRLLAVEPHDSNDEIVNVPSYSSIDAALVAAVQLAYARPDVLFAIDSLRAPLFEMTGSAGEKGIIMPFFTQLTRVSNALAKAGITLLVTVNPMNTDKEYVKAFLSKLSASVPTAILLTESARVEGRVRFSGTLSSRPSREVRAFTLDVTGANSRKRPEDLLTSIEFEPFDTTSNVNYNRSFINAAEEYIK